MNKLDGGEITVQGMSINGHVLNLMIPKCGDLFRCDFLVSDMSMI